MNYIVNIIYNPYTLYFEHLSNTGFLIFDFIKYKRYQGFVSNQRVKTNHTNVRDFHVNGTFSFKFSIITLVVFTSLDLILFENH